MARPTKYHEGIPDLVREYVNDFASNGDLLPTVEGLAAFLDVAPSTVYLWRQNPELTEFSETISILHGKQKKMLFEQGLTGEYNSTIAKLGLSVNHGMVEKTAQELSGPNGGPVQVQEVRRTIVDPQHPDS